GLVSGSVDLHAPDWPSRPFPSAGHNYGLACLNKPVWCSPSRWVNRYAEHAGHSLLKKSQEKLRKLVTHVLRSVGRGQHRIAIHLEPRRLDGMRNGWLGSCERISR